MTTCLSKLQTWNETTSYVLSHIWFLRGGGGQDTNFMTTTTNPPPMVKIALFMNKLFHMQLFQLYVGML